MSRPQAVNYPVGTGDLSLELDFSANAVVVDNPTNQYLHLLSVDQYVPPGTFRTTYVLKTTRIGQARFESPPGYPTAPIKAGQAAALSFYPEGLIDAAGIPTVIPFPTFTPHGYERVNLPANAWADVQTGIAVLGNQLFGWVFSGTYYPALPGSATTVRLRQRLFGVVSSSSITVGQLNLANNPASPTGASDSQVCAYPTPVDLQSIFPSESSLKLQAFAFDLNNILSGEVWTAV